MQLNIFNVEEEEKMKKYHLAVFIVSCMLFIGNLSVAAELQEGFMGYKWGERVSQFEGFTELYGKNDVTYYSNPNESYTIDGIMIDDAIFGFYQGRFFAVYIGVDALETYDRIELYMKLKYGFPTIKTSAKEYLTTFKWKYQDVVIKLKLGQIDGKMKLAFYYDPLSHDLNNQLDEISETSYRFFPIDKNKQPRMIPFLEF
jgi:hypothetical protein